MPPKSRRGSRAVAKSASSPRARSSSRAPSRARSSSPVAELPRAVALRKWRALPHNKRGDGKWTPAPFSACVEAIGLNPDGFSEELEPGQVMPLDYMELYADRVYDAEMLKEFEKILQPVEPFYEQIPKPVEGEWLFTSKEVPQTFEDYVKERPNIPTNLRRTIYIMPLSEPGHDPLRPSTFPDLEVLRQAVEAWYTLPCKVLPPNEFHKKEGARVPERANGHGRDRQYDAQAMLRELKAFVPRDAYCLIGLTMDDIWSRHLNFVFGLAALHDRVGVFSFCRMDPSWHRCGWALNYKTMRYECDEVATERMPDDERIILARAHGTLWHEIGHQFGIRHCQFFQCVMKGSNGLKESEHMTQTTDLCPVCLRKLSWCLTSGNGTDNALTSAEWCMERYKNMLNHCKTVGQALECRSRWLEARVAYLHTGELPSAAYLVDGVLDTDEQGGTLQADDSSTTQQELPLHAGHDDEREKRLRARARAQLLLRAAFQDADSNGDGLMDTEEFKGILQHLNEEFDDSKLSVLFMAADADHDGCVNVQEFIDWLMSADDPASIEARLFAELTGAPCGCC